MAAETIRFPAVAGQFYPASAAALRRDVDRMFAGAPDVGLGARIVALVAPHAGYVYSGAIAAQAFRQVQGQTYDAVILVAPSHHDAFPGVSIMAEGGYATPLGTLPIHTGIARQLLEEERLVHSTELGHQLEHAVEVQLPFIQRSIGTVPIVPLVMLDRSWPTCRALATLLAKAAQGLRVLVVASSDLYHGYSEVECGAIDETTLCEAERADPQTFCADLAAEKVQACGGGPIVVAKEYARLVGATGARVLAHATSAEVAGYHGGYVVGYGAVIYYRADAAERAGAVEKAAEVAPSAELTDADRAVLLDLAKRSIRAAVTGCPPPRPSDASPHLLEPRGAFVTIHRGEDLRGCIGQLYAVRSLADTVISMARAAATGDPRFEPMCPDELDDAQIEISVLSPLRPVVAPEEIVVGRHGIMITGRGRRGVLLPQVATEHGWDRETFLSHTCLKAGLPPNAWRDCDVEIEAFTADVFGDDEPIGRD